MKQLFRFLMIAGTLTMLFIFPLQGHAQLRSPCILTASEKAMIAKITIMRSDQYFDHAKIQECLTFAPHTILIRYEDGHTEIFGIGEQAAPDQKQEVSITNEAANHSSETVIPHIGTQHETNIFTELDQIWRSTDSPDDLSPEKLIRVDALVQELFATTSSDQINLATYNILGSRGNRYLTTIKELSSLSPGEEIIFYEGYLDR
ncbi:MAG: hypothetical protein U1A25_00355, partial [Candidatus Sungbacteria bacterium]|nr:hypothetical protein [Candidatus Sungbacteria bacterium]